MPNQKRVRTQKRRVVVGRKQAALQDFDKNSFVAGEAIEKARRSNVFGTVAQGLRLAKLYGLGLKEKARKARADGDRKNAELFQRLFTQNSATVMELAQKLHLVKKAGKKT